MNMKKIHFAAAVLGIVALLAGCAGTDGAVLKPEHLFCDEISREAECIPDCEALVFESDGAEIYGQLLKPDRSYGENRPCVLFFHGFAGFTRFDDLAQALCRAGCVVLVVHHRGAWGRQGKYSVSNCVQDAAGLVKYVKSPDFQKKYRIDPDAVFLVGHSMGGNTVLNAAARCPGVRGIVMLAPCDIGTMTRTMPRETMREFLTENGLEVLKTDGFEAVYGDLCRHAEEYAFPNAARRLRDTSLLLITGELDTCIPNEMLETFHEAARRNGTLPLCLRRKYRSGHGLMGVRVGVARDIAEFILRACR